MRKKKKPIKDPRPTLNTKVSAEMKLLYKLLNNGNDRSGQKNQEKALADYILNYDVTTFTKKSVIEQFEAQRLIVKAQWQ